MKPTEYVHFNLDASVEQTDNGPRLVGYAIKFDVLSEDLGGYRARIRKGALDKALASGQDIYAFVDHDSTKPLANTSSGTLKLSLDEVGLRAEITPPDTTYAKDAMVQVRDKLKKGMSLGFPTAGATIKWAKENGTKVRDIHEISQLHEVSVVTVPAFSQTDIAATFSLDSATDISVEAKKENKIGTPKHTVTPKKGKKDMSISWTEIKRLEEQKATTFAQANELMAKKDATDDETAELDRLCTEVDDLDKKIGEAKSTYFGRNVARKNVVGDYKINGTFHETKSALGFKQSDLQKYSMLRAISRRLSGHPLDGIEAEVNAAMTEFTGKAPQGFYFPMELGFGDQKFDLDTTAGTGAVNTSVLTSSFIELLRAKTLVNTLGATYLTGLVGNISIPKQTAGATAYWVAEGNAPTESNQTIGQVALTPKTVGAYTDISRKMILQTSLSAEAFVRNDLAVTLALAIDAASFTGSGASNEPRGILNTTGVSETATSGDEFADMVNLESRVEENKALNGSLAYIMRPAVKGLLKTTPTVASGNVMVWQNNQVNGYPAYSTTQLPADVSDYGNMTPVIFGNWNDLVIGMWGALDILVDPYTASNSGTVRIRALQDVDIVLRHAESFAVKYFD